jgi:hypothetical protein
MEKGYKGALMLNEENTFGDIVYDEDKELAKLVEKNMENSRREKDGHNADRIIEKLKEDKFLK